MRRKACRTGSRRLARDLLALGVDVALRNATHALGSDIARDLRIHFHKNKTATAAIFGVLFQHGMAGGVGTDSSSRVGTSR